MHVFMVFELMQKSLLEVLQEQRDGKLDRETVRLIVYQMVKALDHMHSLNVSSTNHLTIFNILKAVHRDIKPENMLLQRVTVGEGRKHRHESPDSGNFKRTAAMNCHSLER
jgi:serine/threonine protein kinase